MIGYKLVFNDEETDLQIGDMVWMDGEVDKIFITRENANLVFAGKDDCSDHYFLRMHFLHSSRWDGLELMIKIISALTGRSFKRNSALQYTVVQ